MSKEIECLTITGGKTMVSAEKLFFRPSVYAVVKSNDRILLLTMKHSGKYFFPGGGVEIEETMSEALHRELLEESGIKVDINEFLGFKEAFFYYYPHDLAMHSFLFFYACDPLTIDLLSDGEVDDFEAEKPAWVNIDSLTRDDFTNPVAVPEAVFESLGIQ